MLLHENLCRVRSIRTSHKRDSEEFTVFGDAKRARTTRTREERKLDPITALDVAIQVSDSKT
jgi:hypothetical protein